MTVCDTLAAITAEFVESIKYDIEQSEDCCEPHESEEPTLLDFVLEDLSACALDPDPSKLTDEGQFHEVNRALERFVDVFFVPVMITPGARFGMPTVMTWYELWEAQFRPDHHDYSEPYFVEGAFIELGSLVESLRARHAFTGCVKVSTPDGDATLSYERTATGWSSSLTSPTGEEWGLPHKICLLTMDLSPGEFTYPVSIYDMLKEPRTYQLRPYTGRNYYERGSGSTWWPNS